MPLIGKLPESRCSSLSLGSEPGDVTLMVQHRRVATVLPLNSVQSHSSLRDSEVSDNLQKREEGEGTLCPAVSLVYHPKPEGMGLLLLLLTSRPNTSIKYFTFQTF